MKFVRARSMIGQIFRQWIGARAELFPDPDHPRLNTEIRWAEEAGFELDEMFGNWFIYQLNARAQSNE